VTGCGTPLNLSVSVATSSSSVTHSSRIMSPMLELHRPNADKTSDNDSRDCELQRPDEVTTFKILLDLIAFHKLNRIQHNNGYWVKYLHGP
jgi:hypothetical protein